VYSIFYILYRIFWVIEKLQNKLYECIYRKLSNKNPCLKCLVRPMCRDACGIFMRYNSNLEAFHLKYHYYIDKLKISITYICLKENKKIFKPNDLADLMMELILNILIIFSGTLILRIYYLVTS